MNFLNPAVSISFLAAHRDPESLATEQPNASITKSGDEGKIGGFRCYFVGPQPNCITLVAEQDDRAVIATCAESNYAIFTEGAVGRHVKHGDALGYGRTG